MHAKSFMTLLLLITACGKAPEMKYASGQPEKNALVLYDRSASEILKIKYNNQVTLHCSLVSSDLPTVEIFWDLPLDSGVYKILNGSKNLYAIKLVSPLRIEEEVYYTDENQQAYHMQFSPALSIAYFKGDKNILRSGEIHKEKDYIEVKLHENVQTTLDKNQQEQLTCKLQTVIAPAYSDQWLME